jgi:uncharacterized membrane protein
MSPRPTIKSKPLGAIFGVGWNRSYRIRSYLRSSLWVIPIVAVVVEQIAAALIHAVDARTSWMGLGLGMEGAKAMFNAVITFSLSFIVFTFGSLLVAIQVASGQYTPRIIATTLLRDNVIRWTVGLFVFTLLFAVRALDRTGDTVPQLVALITGSLGLTCLVAFMFLIDYSARLLRPVSLARRIGDAGLAVIKSIYPKGLENESDGVKSGRARNPVARTVHHRGNSGIVLAVDIERLVAEAEAAAGVVEFAPQVGDFVGSDEPLFYLREGAAGIADEVLRDSVALGSERTLEQDPLFAFRILVDIAIKALSKAINDPTTAVLAIDQLNRLLRTAGRRNLRADEILDRDGQRRVVFRTPHWNDFIHLAFTEIRYCGAENVQIARRLRAMILNLVDTLPTQRHPALLRELDLLDRMLEKLHPLPEDLALARIPDRQGLGGSTDVNLQKEGSSTLRDPTHADGSTPSVPH